MGINQIWVKGLKEKKDKETRVLLLKEELGLDILYKYISEQHLQTMQNYGAMNDYTVSNWQLKVAENNGKLRALEDILDLLKFKEGAMTNG